MRAVGVMAVVVLGVCAGRLAAQETPDTSLQSLLAKKVATAHFETVSSASRFAERAADAPSAVTVVTAEDIRRMGAVTLADALRMVPGLNVREAVQGSPSVTARNHAAPISPRLLVLLDGHPTAMEIYSATDWSGVPVTLNQIEAIEVVRGPGSTLYGASAYDAVVNISTRKPAAGTDVVSSASLAGAQEHHVDVVVRQAVRALRLDGFFASDRQDPVGRWQGRSDQNPIASLYDIRKFGGRVGYATPGGLDLQLSAGLSNGFGSTYLDYSAPLGTAESGKRYLYAELADASLPGDWMLRAHLYLVRHNTPLAAGNVIAGIPVVPGDWSSTTHDGEVTLGKVFASHRLLAGGAARRMAAGALLPVLPEAQRQMLYGAFLQDTWKLASYVDVVAGARYDADDAGRGSFSPRAALLLKPSLAHTFRLSAGQAFRMPTIIESYMFFTQPIAPGITLKLHGDEELRPERITSLELGWVGALRARLNVSAALYRNKFDDAVGIRRTYVTIPGATLPVDLGFVNTRAGRALGGEVAMEWTSSQRLHAEANYAYTDLTDSTGAALPITPRHKLNAEFGLSPLRPLWVDGSFQYTSAEDFASQIDPVTAVAAGGSRVAARGIVSLNTRLDLGRGVSVSAFAQNLFDRKYQDVVGGQYLRRRINGKLEVRF